ncbi:STAS domain-containing protein [Streptomyces sp. NPDC002125]
MTATDPQRPRRAPFPVIAPRGDLDFDSLAPLEAEFETVLAQHDTVILDTGEITFADSTFLRLILAAHHRANLRIAAPSTPVRRLLQVVGADTILHLYPTLEDARSA